MCLCTDITCESMNWCQNITGKLKWTGKTDLALGVALVAMVGIGCVAYNECIQLYRYIHTQHFFMCYDTHVIRWRITCIHRYPSITQLWWWIGWIAHNECIQSYLSFQSQHLLNIIQYWRPSPTNYMHTWVTQHISSMKPNARTYGAATVKASDGTPFGD